MSILLLYAFFTLFFTLQMRNSEKRTIENFIITAVVFSCVLVFSSEVLSYFKRLNFQFILGFWLLFSVLLSIGLRRNKDALINFLNSKKSLISTKFRSVSFFTKISVFSTAILLLVVLLQGIVYPPNNWDSLSYHMSRTYHWMNHESFENFPTHIIRQLYQPCLSEYFIFQVNILNGNDYFSNTVQFSFFLFSIIALLCIIRAVGLPSKMYLPTIILGLTIPEALLQASSTQNDIVHSFFILTSILYAIKTFQNSSFFNYFMFGSAVGLALLSKAIAYIYLPILVLFFGIAILVKVLKNKNWSSLKYAFISIGMVFLINSGHTSRNYAYSGDIMGTDKKESEDYLCTTFSIKNSISITVKNIGLHLDPFFVGDIGNKLIEKFHLVLGTEINDPTTNLFNMKFTCKPGLKHHEDFQPNFLHWVFITFSSILLIGMFFKSAKNKELRISMLYISLISIQFIFFCTLLLWEPWNTRLHLPLFFSSIPIIIFAFYKSPVFYKMRNVLYLLVLGFAFTVVLFNYNRPIITSKTSSKIKINDDRYKKYFANNLELYPEYKACVSQLHRQKIKSIGLIIHIDTWEYPLYSIFLVDKIKSEHINVDNLTKNVPTKKEKITCIISNTINKSELQYRGDRFINSSIKNKNIWMYLKSK